MDKNEELQKWLNDDRYVRIEDMATFWNHSIDCIRGCFRKHTIKPKKQFFGRYGRYAFYNKKQCNLAIAEWNAVRAELRTMQTDNKYVRPQQLTELWGISSPRVAEFLQYRNIQPVKKIHLGPKIGNNAFYDRAECERARPFINQPEQKEAEQVENIGELATATKHQILIEACADDFIWDKVTMKHKIMPVKNYCDERGNFISLFKKDETVSAILAYKNEQKQLLEKCLADKNLVTTKDLVKIWNLDKSAVYNKIYRLKIKPYAKIKLDNGSMWHFYKKSDCIESQDVEKVEEKRETKNKQLDGIFCGDIALGKFVIVSSASDARIVNRLAGDIVCPVLSTKTPDANYDYIKKIIGKDICLVMIEDNDPEHKSVMYWLNLPGASPWIIPAKYGKNITEALDNGVVIRELIKAGLEDLCKGFYAGSSRQIAVMPEPKEQTPDIIPADTIDLFTMSELESELENRGVELTAEVRTKINASDMPEMKHIATMLRGNAKTIAIRLSVLNEIAGQLRETSAMIPSENKISESDTATFEDKISALMLHVRLLSDRISFLEKAIAGKDADSIQRAANKLYEYFLQKYQENNISVFSVCDLLKHGPNVVRSMPIRDGALNLLESEEKIQIAIIKGGAKMAILNVTSLR